VKRRPPAASALTASGLAVVAVAERTPELQSQLAGAIAQAPMRRHEDMDEVHNEPGVEAERPAQSVEQAPPVQGMPPGRELMADNVGWDHAAHWWAAEQAAMDTTMHRNLAVLLDAVQRGD